MVEMARKMERMKLHTGEQNCGVLVYHLRIEFN
jgi:hypothetical protein